MASSSFVPFLFLCPILLFLISPSVAKPSFRTKALVLPVSKDAWTSQYIARINQRTPLVPLKVTLDLGGLYLWVDCDKGYVSSSYKPVPCGSARCRLTNSKGVCTSECYFSPRPGCHNNTCYVLPDNPIERSSTSGEVGQDVVSIQSTDGSNPGKVVSVPNLIFTCGITDLLDGLASGVTGMAGLGRSQVSLPSQFSSAFKFDRKFAICLSSSAQAQGVVFFGNGPYVLLPGMDVSRRLLYTPLILNPVGTGGSYFQGDASSDYFIGVKSIKVNGNAVPLNNTLLSIDKEGNGGTKISTVDRYTILQTSIYKAVVNAFVKSIAKIPRVKPVAPFGACFDGTKFSSTRVGPGVPTIELELKGNVTWIIFGSNSMVPVSNGVLCLGFVDGGLEATTSIVIGGHQIEDNLLQFDLANKRLGFSSSLLFRQTTCANFNFTSSVH